MEDVEKLDEVADDLARGEMGIRADTPVLELEEPDEVLRAKRALIPEVARMNIRELLRQDEKLLIGEGIQLDNGREHVIHALAGEAALCQARAQGFVRVDSAAAVLD